MNSKIKLQIITPETFCSDQNIGNQPERRKLRQSHVTKQTPAGRGVCRSPSDF